MVANAWDADAEKVRIIIDQENKRIVIIDDGAGMTVDDMNEKYLRIGYRRREEDREHGKHTAKGRKVMGRKGVGKLSLFSIAEVIKVQSAKDGVAQGFRMSTKEIRETIERGNGSYHPKPLGRIEIDVTRGTKIVLEKVKRRRLERGAAALRKRLARRFSIIGARHNFTITINDDPITVADRDDLSVVQFLWALGDSDIPTGPQEVRRETLPGRLEHWNKGWRIRGWIGTAHKPQQLDSEDAGNLNSIVVFARGRLFHENILENVNEGKLYTKYLTGQIEADFLDEDDQPDIATSDRQRIQEDDPRYDELLGFLKASLGRIENFWNEWRSEHELKKVQQRFPSLTGWFSSLKDDYRKQAERLIANLSALPLDDESDRRLLYKHGIWEFERMKLSGSTQKLVQNISNTGKLLEILANRDSLEASLYREILRSRLEVIEAFWNLVDNDALERLLQKYLFNHLWILDPAWERVNSDTFIESRLMREGVIVEDMTEKEKLARVDIAYRTSAGKHIIVELKRPSRKMDIMDILGQGRTYSDKLEKILRAQGEQSPNIEVVFVLGKRLEEEDTSPDRIKYSMYFISPGSRIVYYDTLIKNARDAYSEYLQKTEDVDKIEELVNQIG